MSDDDNSDDDFDLPCLHIRRTKCKFSSDEDDEPDDLKRALRQIQHQKIDVSRVKSIAKVQEREKEVDDLLDNRSQYVLPEIESNFVISLDIEAENSSILQLSCGERVFDIDKFQCVFRLEDVTLLSSGYRALPNLSKLERRLLDESSSWMLQNLSQILLICRPHNITNYSAFLLYLLRVASVCDSLLLMHCIEENIENFLKEVRRTFKASISIVDIFKIFINFGLIVEPYCPSKYLKTVYIHLKNNVALKDRGDKPQTPRTAHWFSNLNTVVSILDQLLPHCDFEDRDWLQMFLVLLWTCMDETLTHLEIKSTLKNCLHTIIEKFSTKFLNSGEGSCMLTGMTYNGQDANGKERWDGCANVDFAEFSKVTTFGSIIKTFNINTNLWVAQYVFKRLKFLGNRFISQAAALSFLALWHGLHSGYYICFFNEFIVMWTEKDFETFLNRVPKVKCILTSNALKIPLFIIMTIHVDIFMGYCLLPFVLLSWDRYNKVYGSVYYIGHIIYLGWPIVAPVLKLLVPKQKESAKTQ